jgi:hypothetical protein
MRKGKKTNQISTDLDLCRIARVIVGVLISLHGENKSMENGNRCNRKVWRDTAAPDTADKRQEEGIKQEHTQRCDEPFSNPGQNGASLLWFPPAHSAFVPSVLHHLLSLAIFLSILFPFSIVPLPCLPFLATNRPWP